MKTETARKLIEAEIATKREAIIVAEQNIASRREHLRNGEDYLARLRHELAELEQEQSDDPKP